MNNLREQLSAWAVVAVLAATLVAVWDLRSPVALQGDAASVCFDTTSRSTVVQLPRGTSWDPDAALAGLPQTGDSFAAYDLAEARNLARYDDAGISRPRVAGGAAPTAMC